MQIKTIKSEKDIVAGPYIRAVINYHGRHWLEFLNITGKPFNAKAKHMKGYRKINVICREQHGEMYISDLGVKGAQNKNPFTSALIPFSNKVWNHLKDIKDVREFSDKITKCQVTDFEYVQKQCYWQAEKQKDRALIIF